MVSMVNKHYAMWYLLRKLLASSSNAHDPFQSKIEGMHLQPQDYKTSTPNHPLTDVNCVFDRVTQMNSNHIFKLFLSCDVLLAFKKTYYQKKPNDSLDV